MTDDTPRCTRCARPISAALSLLTGFGSHCRRHADLLDLLDQALQGRHGGDQSKSDNVTVAPTGNSSEKALRRLRKEAEAGNEQAAEQCRAAA